jgi:hypothetical protein
MVNPYYAETPTVAAPCRCRRPLYLGGEVCLMCGRRRPLKIDLDAMRIRRL